MSGLSLVADGVAGGGVSGGSGVAVCDGSAVSVGGGVAEHPSRRAEEAGLEAKAALKTKADAEAYVQAVRAKICTAFGPLPVISRYLIDPLGSEPLVQVAGKRRRRRSNWRTA